MGLLIKGVSILGADKTYPEPSDVFVNGDKISAIGDFANKKTDTVIDGQGMYLSPGFIDINTDSDHFLTLFNNPAQADFLMQGVTTIMGGMCGSSLAPLLYGTLESIRKWTDIDKINVNWHSVDEFLSVLEKKPLAVNFGTFIGHSTIRRALVGDALRNLTKNELKVFSDTISRALKEGGFGFSTGLEYVHSFRTPYSELKILAEATKNGGGLYATHLRKTGKEVYESVEETVNLAKDTGIGVLINHFEPLFGSETEYEAALTFIENLPKTWDFHFDLYPFNVSVLALYTFLPGWAKNGNLEVMHENLKDTWLQARIKKDIVEVNPHDFVVSQAPGNEPLVGKSLHDLKTIFGVSDFRDALIRLMLTTKLKATIFYKNISEKHIIRALKSQRSLIASNAASFEATPYMLKPERATGTFTKFLSLVEKENLMPLQDAIRKITREPAEKLKLQKRGVIREGNFADLTGFKNGEIKFVVVNGKLVYKDGAFQGQYPGKPLRNND